MSATVAADGELVQIECDQCGKSCVLAGPKNNLLEEARNLNERFGWWSDSATDLDLCCVFSKSSGFRASSIPDAV